MSLPREKLTRPLMEAKNHPTEHLIEELEKAVEIDRNDVDGATMAQPDLFWRVARAHNEAIGVRDYCQLLLDEARAAASIRARASVKEKLTIGEVEAVVVMATAKEARDLLVSANIVGRLQALREGYMQRSYALRMLHADRIEMGYRERLTTDTKKFMDPLIAKRRER